MSFSVHNAQAKSVTFSDDSFSVLLTDGRILTVPLAYFPRLLNAKPDQLAKYELSGGGTGIHWDSLNEDISVAGLLLGKGDQTKSPTPQKTKTA
ncbi:MAG: DUF2442 domain-containing protein [Bdellovibrio sp.]|nr:MAG: DUF2442 domain-containing protein [Bdellovibrio sp.]